ncbi:cytoplasmic dynein 2 intermediate chain 1-like isoform X2 [Mya arenaria]|uniref:cytoplasmic dynein 2 intermediate chain 1-like isoform X2 n=1 Tax=Mya arenaria TaxID=6604 RepID=UPI0022E4F969|nr:cytoplasmic dynein 2 intermediate chain 1-like isoform X2 [Mya arenaria]
MPSQKGRSKEDTWTTGELTNALGKPGDRRRERVNGEDKHKRHRDGESDKRHRRKDEDADVRLTEEERDRLREERRQKREGKDGGSSRDKKGKEIQFKTKTDNKAIELDEVDDADDRRRRHGDKERRHHDDRDRRDRDKERRHRDEDEGKSRRSEDDRERRKRHDDEDDNKRRRHRDDDERRSKARDDDGDRKRRSGRQREEVNEDEEEDRRRRHEEKKERRKDDRHDDRRRDDRSDRHDRDDRREKHPDRDDKHREKDDRSDRHIDRDREDRHKDRDRKETDKEKEERRQREREERRREKEEKKREEEEKRKQEQKKEEDDDYDYEEDFEDYEDDFEDEGDDDEEEKEESKPRPRHTGDSEVDDVLRALDAENERLLQGSRSPQVTSYNRQQDRQQDSDEDSDAGYEKTYQPRRDRPKTAINFVSAKQRAMSNKTASKTQQRGRDLLKMIELDYTYCDILDLPPVNEYDLYIRSFGSTNTRQAYVQTNEDNIEREIQTEEADVRSKWTQHPPEDFRGCGRGDGEKDQEEEESQHQDTDMGRLNHFLEKAGQVIAILLEEGKENESGHQGRSQTHIAVSEGYTQIDLLPILQGRHVVYSHFSPVQPNMLVTAYSLPTEVSEENTVSKRGVLCVWNTNEPNYPQKILVCTGQPRCCCFSPVRPFLVFAGMTDGSIAMWDLREPSSIHRSLLLNDEAYSLRYPTYDTAGVLNEENHHSPVSCVQPIYTQTDSSSSNSEDASSGLSFQLVSTEEAAVLHFWVVAEIGSPDISGAQNDFGLLPGGGVKLIKSSSITLQNPSKDSRLQTGLRALDMAVMPTDPNHFYVATDSGFVVHGIRFGKRVFPRAHSPVIESIVEVSSIDFSPFGQPCFLAGSSDGTFSLYTTQSENPLITWPHLTKGHKVQCVRWSRSRPCVFYVLDSAATLYVFDLLEGDMNPKNVETLAKERVTSFSLTTDQRGEGSSGKLPQMLFSLESGKIEIHTVAKSLREPDQLETDYLASYLQRF